MPTADEEHIGEMLITWTKAIADGDWKGILAHHATDERLIGPDVKG